MANSDVNFDLKLEAHKANEYEETQRQILGRPESIVERKITQELEEIKSQTC